MVFFLFLFLFSFFVNIELCGSENVKITKQSYSYHSYNSFSTNLFLKKSLWLSSQKLLICILKFEMYFKKWDSFTTNLFRKFPVATLTKVAWWDFEIKIFVRMIEV